MVKLELDIFKMFDVYTKEVRSILELAVPVWHSRLTIQQTSDIERIQKIAFKIILQASYQTYPLACSTFSTKTLASKNLKTDHSFFTKVGTTVNTRYRSDLVKEFKCRTGRYQKSSLPYLASLINSNNRK